jgi:hypothetical protein
VPVLTNILNRRNSGGMAGTTWGYDALDEATGGIRGGEVAFICGTPGSAKSAIASTSRSASPPDRQARVDRVGRDAQPAGGGTDPEHHRSDGQQGRAKGEKSTRRVGLPGQGRRELKPLPLTIDDTGQPRIKDILGPTSPSPTSSAARAARRSAPFEQGLRIRMAMNHWKLAVEDAQHELPRHRSRHLRHLGR